MSTEFNDHPLLDLEKLFLDDPLEIVRLQQEFEINGWCFVRLSQNARSFTSQLNHISQSLSDFFALHQHQKDHYLSTNVFGYSRVGHKDGIKILTDQHGIADSQSVLPMNIAAALQHVSQLVSDLTYRLKPIITKLAVSDEKISKEVKLSDLAMLDIVSYFNRNTGPLITPEVGYDTNEVNCVPHYDPGLFSLSILSTCDGLQLKDQRENKWIDGPNNSQPDQSNIGVIWLGEAASILTKNRFKSGIHRVVYPRTAHQPRLTIWQEVCTEDQIQQLLERNDNVKHLPPGAQVTLMNQLNSVPMIVLPDGENRVDFMKRVESQRGIPRTKYLPSDMLIFNRPVVLNNDTPPTNKNKNSFSAKRRKK